MHLAPDQRIQETTDAIRRILRDARRTVSARTDERMEEMDRDGNAHWLVFNALGIDDVEADLIDRYQNKGRILYTNAGNAIGNALMECFRSVDPSAGKLYVPNINVNKDQAVDDAGGAEPGKKKRKGKKSEPVRFEIDCLLKTLEAIEFKWRDATTDGDHVNKEISRVRSIRAAGYAPIRLMLFMPERRNAARVQAKMRSVYQAEGGLFLAGSEAFNFIRERTGIDLMRILEEEAEARRDVGAAA